MIFVPKSEAEPKLERKLYKLAKREREELLAKLVAKHTGAARAWGGETTLRVKVFAVLAAYPRASYRAIAELVEGDDSLETRVKIGATVSNLAKAGHLKKVGRGAFEVVPDTEWSAPKASPGKTRGA